MYLLIIINFSLSPLSPAPSFPSHCNENLVNPSQRGFGGEPQMCLGACSRPWADRRGYLKPFVAGHEGCKILISGVQAHGHFSIICEVLLTLICLFIGKGVREEGNPSLQYAWQACCSWVRPKLCECVSERDGLPGREMSTSCSFPNHKPQLGQSFKST